MIPDSATTTLQGRLFAALVRGFGRLPLIWMHRIGALIGRLFLLFPNRNRRVAERNLALCFPEASEAERRRLLHRNFLETGRSLTELGYFWTRPAGDVLGLIRDVEGQAALDAALNGRQGVLLAAPHLGAWELLCQYLAARGPLTVLYREPRDPGVEAVVNAGRKRLGTELVRAGPPGVRRLFRALKEGRTVGILPDQQPKRGNGEFAPCFGVEALTMVLFTRLAAKSEAPVVLGFAERLADAQGFRLHFRAGPAAISSPDNRVAVAALNQAVEELVRMAPEQYQWGYKRFSIRPEGEPPLY